jgi:hypothetical protein
MLLERSPPPEPRCFRWFGPGAAKVSSRLPRGPTGLSVGIMAAMLVLAGEALAAVPAKAVTETVEYVVKTFAREAAEEGSESIARQAASLAARYGDEGLEALRKAGPRGFRVIEEAGGRGLDAVKLINRYGDDAVWAISKPGGMEILLRYGDDGARALIRHKGVAEAIIQTHGRAAVEALNAVGPQQARRIAMLQGDGVIAAGESGEKLLAVVARYGDRAMDFIWRNKFALGATAVLGTFLADPQPYLDGTKELVVEGLSRPVSEFGREAARNTDWTLVALAGIGVVGLLAALRTWLRARRLRD